MPKLNILFYDQDKGPLSRTKGNVDSVPFPDFFSIALENGIEGDNLLRNNKCEA